MTCMRSLVVVAVTLGSLARPQAQDKAAWFGTPESPCLMDLWSYAPRCFGVATYLSAGTRRLG
jgi:hypothetical protein